MKKKLSTVTIKEKNATFTYKNVVDISLTGNLVVVYTSEDGITLDDCFKHLTENVIDIDFE